MNVIYGTSSGLSATATPDQRWTEGAASVEGTPQHSDRFGDALAPRR